MTKRSSNALKSEYKLIANFKIVDSEFLKLLYKILLQKVRRKLANETCFTSLPLEICYLLTLITIIDSMQIQRWERMF